MTYKILILIIGIICSHPIFSMQEPEYTRISKVPAGTCTIFRATKIPDGTSIEVIYNTTAKEYYGTESGPMGDCGDRILFDYEAIDLFKKLERLSNAK